MPNLIVGSISNMARSMKYWEDLRESTLRQYGPLSFTTQLLDQLLDLMGEKHPIHANDSFAQSNNRKQRIVPGGFIHSITSGWITQHGSPVAILGLRSMTWNYVRPLYPDVPFYFTTETVSAEAVDEKVGLLSTRRRVCDEADRVYAIGQIDVVIKRRPSNQDL
jgi:hypothetical protein